MSPREFYQSIHPDYFSDTVVEEASELDRTLLEYHLSSLTSRSQEADFERFARQLCEKEVCPNLLPSSGPTGGGDSKVDSETYPIAYRLALAWYSGFGREASEERWAFAFSAKADWRPKVKSDVKKIAATRRGYSKAFFVTNQTVAARVRAEVEDALRTEHCVDVRIFDRNWILEKVFTNHHEDLAVSELKVTGFTRRHVRTGPGDMVRTGDLEAAEARIREALESGRLGPVLVDDALDAANACRSLERPRVEVEGVYGRANQLALKYGTPRQQVESAYQFAWTLIWWLEDFDRAVKQYEVVESRARDSDNVYDLVQLSNLWTIIYGRQRTEFADTEDAGWLEQRTTTLRTSLTRLAQDSDRPSTALEARTVSLRMDLFDCLYSGKDPSNVFDQLKEVAQQVEGLVGYALEPLVQSITSLGSMIEENASYNSLFEAIVEVSSRRDGEIRAAKLLLTRGVHLMDQDRPAKAIAVVGQALGRLFKYETRDEVVQALYLCGQAYERLGLQWAARGTYLSGASIAANEFWSYGEVTRGFALCVNRLKWLEILLGRVPHVLAWYEVDQMSRNYLAAKGISISALESGDELFDTILARLIIRTKGEILPSLESLPDVLDNLGLEPAATALLFLLGCPERLEEISSTLGDTPDHFASKLWNLKADVQLPAQPEYYGRDSVLLETKVLGCRIRVSSSTVLPCVEVSEAILATAESFLATSAGDRAFAVEPELTLHVSVGAPTAGFVSYVEQERLGRPHIEVACASFDPHDFAVEAQKEIGRQLFELAMVAVGHVVRFRDTEGDLLALFRDERVADRATSFAGSIGRVRNVLGDQPKLRLDQWIDASACVYRFARTTPWRPDVIDSADCEVTEPARPLEAGIGGPPVGLIDSDRIAHDQIELVSPIRERLWTRAGWEGTAFFWDAANESPPILGIVFRDKKAGMDIFAGWLTDIGREDVKETLRVTIVRGINTKKPHAYRVLIGGNLDPSGPDRGLIYNMYRVNQMDATNPNNLGGFLNAYSVHKRFLLIPSYFLNGEPVLEFEFAIGLHTINVRNAWEIGLNDFDSGGVQADDEIVIPSGVTDPPVLVLQAWIRTKRKVVN